LGFWVFAGALLWGWWYQLTENINNRKPLCHHHG
jgi:hypothetical protein